jgi:hypothetical protein
MHLRNIHRAICLFALVLVTASVGLGQSPTPTVKLAMPTNDIEPRATDEVVVPASNVGGKTWQNAQMSVPAKSKLMVVTFDQLDHQQGCRVQSFTDDRLVCSRNIGRSRTYLRQEIAALIVPGDSGTRLPLFLGFNGGLGAAIWGTVVLAAACPAYAVGTGIAALIFFSLAGVTAYADDQPARLQYLAPGQELSRKLGYVER